LVWLPLSHTPEQLGHALTLELIQRRAALGGGQPLGLSGRPLPLEPPLPWRGPRSW
jgi:hypothetical protein